MITPTVFFFCMFTMTIYLLTTKIQRKRKFLYNNTPGLQSKLRKYSSFSCKFDDSENTTLVLHMEEGLLRSSSLFPYFMLVAFEAGGILRAILVFHLYPFVYLSSNDMKVKILVFLCFFGLKADKFRVGRSVLPKFLMDDVGYEVYNEVMNYKNIVVVSDLPTVMIEGFVKGNLGIDLVIGRDLKVAFGYFVGLMEEKKIITDYTLFSEIIGDGGKMKFLVGFNSFSSSFVQELLSVCEEIYMVSTTNKKKWTILPKDKYPKPLIFHDGRLSFMPTFNNTLIMFLWLPFGLLICILRISITFILPLKFALPILAFAGIKIKVTNNSTTESIEPILYVCNHRTLLDPVYISLALMKPVTAVTYSLSHISELISPIKTTPLMRNRGHDLRKMKELLSKGDLVVCPEGTTCREPYLLRFSPLFAEVSDNIVPVALDIHMITMFYGTTASGLKCLDPVFFLLNPFPTYGIWFLERLLKSCTCSGCKSNIEVANHVQKEIAKTLGFECTSMTRKDKYRVLAGNETIV